MTDITPTYYAEINYEIAEFELIGRHFELIPDDAIGILARYNDAPTELVETTSAPNILDVMERPDQHHLVFKYSEIHNILAPRYLGAIVSADRQTIYWVNDTKPLP